MERKRSRANHQVISQDWRTTCISQGRRYRELRGQVTRGQAMGYKVQIDHIEYVGTKDGRPYSLVGALAAVHGVGNARVLAPNGREVRYLGRKYTVVLAPLGTDTDGRRKLDRYNVGVAAKRAQNA